jgi:hypothetical protein
VLEDGCFGDTKLLAQLYSYKSIFISSKSLFPNICQLTVLGIGNYDGFSGCLIQIQSHLSENGEDQSLSEPGQVDQRKSLFPVL